MQNEHYWDRENLGLAGVNLLIIEDNAARVTAFLDNRVDWMNEPPNDQLAFLAGLDSFHGGPQLGTYYYRFNVTDEIVQDRRIRRALALALNRAELCRCTLDDLYTVPRGFVPPLPGYESEDGLVRYDPQEARRLLAEAGYPNGEGLPTLSILYNTNENHRIIAQFVQDQWQLELGIEVELINAGVEGLPRDAGQRWTTRSLGRAGSATTWTRTPSSRSGAARTRTTTRAGRTRSTTRSCTGSSVRPGSSVWRRSARPSRSC